ncbi:hypothetical protein [Microbacterium sp. LWH12-1.2]|uniref:hypothetical protein n=1 Tax=Microbacterium sp. LWH12-1.2 TaxID=3135259 RepID=UPI003415FDFE
MISDSSAALASAITAHAVELFHRFDPDVDAAAGLRTALAAWEKTLKADGHDVRVHLIPHQERFDGSVSYDILVRGLERTISVGLSSRSGLPWPRRGVVAADEHAVVRVNGTMLMVADVVAVLSDVFEDTAMLDRVLDEALLREALREEVVGVGDDELQDAFDAWRRGRRLLSAAETEVWLGAHGSSLPDLLSRLERLVARRKLADTVHERLSDESAAAMSPEAALSEHLSRLRGSADVEWYWGRSEQTNPVSGGSGRKS